MPTLSLTIQGPPMGKGAAMRSRTTGATFNTRKTADWMGAARAELATQLPRDWSPLSVPCSLYVTALFGRPKTGPNRFRKRAHPTDQRTRRAQKPDADNVLKIVCDSMTHAGIWTDDALADAACRRLFVARGESPRTEILLVWGDTLDRLPWPPHSLEAW